MTDQERPNPQAYAQGAVAHAIKTGALTRGPCEICGDPVTDAHHDDYSKPLDVRWLCRSHHTLVHNALRASRTPPGEIRSVSARQFRDRMDSFETSVAVFKSDGNGMRRKIGIWFPITERTGTDG